MRMKVAHRVIRVAQFIAVTVLSALMVRALWLLYVLMGRGANF